MTSGQEKICSVCKIERPLDEFHRRSHYVSDGRRSACKHCTRMATQESRRRKPPTIDGWKEKIRSLTREAIRAGELVPEACAWELGLGRRCGCEDVHPHHPRYDGEGAHLNVIWLCRFHHALEHGKRGWTKQLDLFLVEDSDEAMQSKTSVDAG